MSYGRRCSRSSSEPSSGGTCTPKISPGRRGDHDGPRPRTSLATGGAALPACPGAPSTASGQRRLAASEAAWPPLPPFPPAPPGRQSHRHRQDSARDNAREERVVERYDHGDPAAVSPGSSGPPLPPFPPGAPVCAGHPAAPAEPSVPFVPATPVPPRPPRDSMTSQSAGGTAARVLQHVERLRQSDLDAGHQQLVIERRAQHAEPHRPRPGPALPSHPDPRPHPRTRTCAACTGSRGNYDGVSDTGIRAQRRREPKAG